MFTFVEYCDTYSYTVHIIQVVEYEYETLSLVISNEL